MKKVFNVYSDPGHAWVKVPKKLLHTLGIAHLISRYSYERNGNVYLEEDIDVPVFMKAMAGIGIKPRYVNYHTNRQSRIRTYGGYRYAFAFGSSDYYDRELVKNYIFG